MEADLNPAARSAVEQAMDLIKPHLDSDPRLAALHDRLNATRNPLDVSADADAARDPVGVKKRAAQLVRIQKAQDDAAAAGELTAEDRMRDSRAVRKAQLEYLAQVSPSAAAVIQRESVYAGVRRGELPRSMARRIAP
jgi:ABC-type Na+ efflux pump permease subunit